MKTVSNVAIIGIGNILLGDDGVGPYVVRTLEASYEFDPNVQVLDVGTPALDFIDNLVGMDAVILIDSVENDRPAGTITLYRKEDILRHGISVRMDPHSPALGESLLTADLMGICRKNCYWSESQDERTMQAANSVLKLEKLSTSPSMWCARNCGGLAYRVPSPRSR